MNIYEVLDNRLVISLAVPEKEKDFYKAFVLELVSEIMVMDYKHEYVKNHLKSYTANQALWTGFLWALTIFDKQTDKDLIKKNLSFTNELLIDSSYHFKMWEVERRWKEITELVEDNLSGLLTRDSFVDLMKFLILASDMEADCVFIKNCKNEPKIMINDTKNAINLCFFDEKVDNDTRILSELICLSPREIVIENDANIGQEIVGYISSIFDGKVHVGMENKSINRNTKTVDKSTNVVYNN